jgi:signal transduction histidine kinase/CheY-like chemotaxis protein
MGFTIGLVRELDTVGDWGLLTTDADLTISGWNRWLERHVGRQAEAFVGRPLFDVFPNLVARKFDRYYRQALAGQIILLSQQFHKYLLPLPPPVAEARFEFMQQTARVIPLVDGEAVCGTVTVVEDVTERVAHEAELRERVDALRDADRRKDEFLAMLAHELRNPLAPISHAVQILGLIKSKEPLLDNARAMIERQVTHLVRLVDDLLDVSRVSRGKVQLQKMPLDLSTVARQAVETSRPLIDSHHHHLTVTLPQDAVPVDGDFVRLAQVVTNLLNNAAKYTDEGGQIWLTIEKASPEEAVVRVRDNGRGIDPLTLPVLFNLFYQVDRNLDRAEGGLGLGLSLVKSIVEMHGGGVEAHSAGRGKGSEFTVHLPLLRQVPTPTSTESSGSSPAARPTRVLVVDDNRDAAETLALLLKMEGHEVWTCHDGRKAVELALREQPTLVVMDIGLPGLNGYQACRAMREGGLTEALMIAITGYGQEEDRRLSRESGFDVHLVKPVDLLALKKLLAERGAAR